ncbi:hypothetical protein [Actinomadura sp. NBRC 104425]|uniref:hypothetical protein n=1 Tax=Actinomadura sp. NBRC 104425 TaxID=3032204 RepID=UPI002554F2FB|nr:hypothetical protein [Actinomadura sp. NBRC 104425]
MAALHAAIQARRELVVSLVSQHGVSWVNIARYGDPRRTVDVVYDYRNGDWWFTSIADGARIARAWNVTGCVQAIIWDLGRS